MTNQDAASKVVERVEKALRRVIVPGFDIDVVSAGIVRLVRVSRDRRRVAIVLDYTGSDPSCFACRFLNWLLWGKLLQRIEEEMRREGFEAVEFFDYRTGLRLGQGEG
ncbi:hypothetical protein Pyrfu_1106 [Pyrolobus fumarii 1A]|uniref:MIP18 family-like domain-containing protein n=1 Tax=Pyrolobus fumarii (strain DSM 11204 / 1A) TaxID=694429 RepID=G0EFE9_PYRF1|nr:iron-sulfur cluster assembly protein [Pyrolobus fumarii]AEM38973.1 hypothetical protein Pyrfu_1106 [Pyrolobus fumarii 1A]